MNYHGDTHQKASIYVKNDLNYDWIYRVTNLTRNTPALCAGNLGGNIHQTSFSSSLLTTASSSSLRLFTWSQISRGMSRHFCRSTWSHTCQHILHCDHWNNMRPEQFLLFDDFFFIVIMMMEMMMIRKAMIVIIMMMMILTMVTCLGTFSQTSLGTWLHTLRGTSLQT